VQSLNGFLRVLFVFHGHKAETARAAGHAIHDHIDLLDRAVSGEHILQIVFRGVE
jgi:hypothetical protein